MYAKLVKDVAGEDDSDVNFWLKSQVGGAPSMGAPSMGPTSPGASPELTAHVFLPAALGSDDVRFLKQQEAMQEDADYQKKEAEKGIFERQRALGTG